MSRRRFYYTSGLENPLILALLTAGGSAVIFLIIVLVTGAHP